MANCFNIAYKDFSDYLDDVQKLFNSHKCF